MKSSLEVTLAETEHELLELVEQRLKNDERINKVVSGIRSLANLLEDDIERISHLRALEGILERLNKPGFSKMLCNVLFAFPNGLTQIEIRNVLVNSGTLDMKEYTNPAASIHTTLRRLIDSGTVEVRRRGEDRVFRMKARNTMSPPTPTIAALARASLRNAPPVPISVAPPTPEEQFPVRKYTRKINLKD